MRDVFRGRLGTAAIVAGVAVSAVVAGAPAALATGGGQGHAEHGNGHGAGHAKHAHEPGPPPHAQAAPAATQAPRGGTPPARKARPKPSTSSARSAKQTARRARGRSRPPAEAGGPRAVEQRGAPRAAKPRPAAPAASQRSSTRRAETPLRGRAEGHRKTTICHATGSATNPYVEISIPAPALRAHDRHQDGRDIIPAPAGGCPGAGDQTPSEQAPPLTSAQGTPSPGGPGAVSTTAASRSTAPLALPALAADVPAPVAERAGDHAVLGVSGTTAPEADRDGAVLARAAGDAPATAAQAVDDGDLPFTGLALWLLLLGGGSLLTLGLGLRLAARARS